VTIAVVIAAASLTSFAESYRGLFDWAREHGLSGLWAAAWPLQLDTFIAVGELALFVALADRWTVRSRIGAWAVTLLGLAASVAGNVGHVHSRLLSDRATAAVPRSPPPRRRSRSDSASSSAWSRRTTRVPWRSGRRPVTSGCLTRFRRTLWRQRKRATRPPWRPGIRSARTSSWRASG